MAPDALCLTGHPISRGIGAWTEFLANLPVFVGDAECRWIPPSALGYNEAAMVETAYRIGGVGAA